MKERKKAHHDIDLLRVLNQLETNVIERDLLVHELRILLGHLTAAVDEQTISQFLLRTPIIM